MSVSLDSTTTDILTNDPPLKSKAVISLENIQIHRYALEPIGTVLLRWCLLFPSCFFGDFFVTRLRRYADKVSLK